MKWLKKSTCILCTVILVHHAAPAQSFMHSLGGKIAVLFGTLEDDYSSGDFAMKQTLITYFPRVNFIEGQNASLSIGFPVGAGIGVASNTIGDDVGISFAYDLPVVLDYNFGCKSVMDDAANFGGYFGAGFGYYKVMITGSSYSDFKGASYGPLVRGGIRFRTGDPGWDAHAITIGLFYKKGMERSKLNTIGLDVLFDF